MKQEEGGSRRAGEAMGGRFGAEAYRLRFRVRLCA